MYCSNSDDSDCLPPFNNEWRYDLEGLFMKFGVDIVFEAHQHSYERLWPTYNGTVKNGTADLTNPYYHPGAPVHIVAGAAGCDESLDVFEVSRCLAQRAKQSVPTPHTTLRTQFQRPTSATIPPIVRPPPARRAGRLVRAPFGDIRLRTPRRVEFDDPSLGASPRRGSG